ncbi:hypothetical protein IFM61606_00565 [Aspergillus udagawae]|uniref:Uncharacterized protein n=1 Tax=Aspergillus udagawae TaxID=91492 RepID=A0ABQ1AG30_9EURO|nr:hypothetical protein IFM51744_04272 [Aspergillus udagawae]GFF81255.1 hypothetical protein IFM53868_03073 [Aspergillus udagawae]GFG02354.1 hypothetical protein IFM5058_00898 [Aspergillus udagawae]GFG20461.1 hypothetical protein IFM61606_00565 [Aspergillus udagawae]
MKLTTVLSLAPLLGAATAQGQQQQQPFTLNVRWSNSPLKGPLNANAGAFWIGKPTASICPENGNVPDCPSVNTTSFVAQDSKLFLNAAVPGGQQVYISPQGQLTYTVPHSAYIPEGSLTDLPISSTDSFLNPFLTLWLCSDNKDAKQWKVWAEYTNATTGAITNNGSNGSNACTRIALEAQPYKGPTAWEF